MLFDMPAWCAAWKTFTKPWRDREAGHLPRPDLANLDVYLEVGSALNHEGTEVQNIADYEGWWAARLDARNALRPIPVTGGRARTRRRIGAGTPQPSRHAQPRPRQGYPTAGASRGAREHRQLHARARPLPNTGERTRLYS